VSDGTSATVSFSETAPHALEQVGEKAYDAVEHAATQVEHFAEQVVDAVKEDVSDAASTAMAAVRGKGLAQFLRLRNRAACDASGLACVVGSTSSG
jgi:hypothetical protein